MQICVPTLAMITPNALSADEIDRPDHIQNTASDTHLTAVFLYAHYKIKNSTHTARLFHLVHFTDISFHDKKKTKNSERTNKATQHLQAAQLHKYNFAYILFDKTMNAKYSCNCEHFL